MVVYRYPMRWARIEDELRRIDLYSATSPEEVFDGCKTLCETVIKTILTETHTMTDEECDGLSLEALKPLLCEILELPDDHAKLTKAQITYLQNTRNTAGIAGHGRSLSRQAEIRQALEKERVEHILALTDTLLTDIIHCFEKKFPAIDFSEINEQNEAYDDFVDGQYSGITINEVPYLASEILFNVDRTAYNNGLKEFQATQEDAHIDSELGTEIMTENTNG